MIRAQLEPARNTQLNIPAIRPNMIGMVNSLIVATPKTARKNTVIKVVSEVRSVLVKVFATALFAMSAYGMRFLSS